MYMNNIRFFYPRMIGKSIDCDWRGKSTDDIIMPYGFFQFHSIEESLYLELYPNSWEMPGRSNDVNSVIWCPWSQQSIILHAILTCWFHYAGSTQPSSSLQIATYMYNFYHLFFIIRQVRQFPFYFCTKLRQILFFYDIRPLPSAKLEGTETMARRIWSHNAYFSQLGSSFNNRFNNR